MGCLGMHSPVPKCLDVLQPSDMMPSLAGGPLREDATSTRVSQHCYRQKIDMHLYTLRFAIKVQTFSSHSEAHHLTQYLRNSNRVNDVGLPALPPLAIMGVKRHLQKSLRISPACCTASQDSAVCHGENIFMECGIALRAWSRRPR